ncbi:ABC transporter permease [Dyadobacter frigoris]|uniref:ABC transporter permease n=1 Tax=Dyadobacter frigoris TaxID=2576211 RepID=A0A4V6Y209_9BACT|nr:ABC transporter permease [Dyadobacter frigoris]TKT93703.1 hypothetical protein FDK13_00380 [Dyadobacter frigoris]GLU51088.1 bacitracin ABC transporter permease [Dyadobacter frigoris]
MKLFYTELIKLKNTFAFWLTIMGALFMPLLLLSAYLLSTKEFVPAPGVNPWYEYLLRTFNGSCLFSTGFISLIIGLILNVEHKAHSWKHLFTLPVSRGKVYLVKLTFIFATIITFIVLYFVFAVSIGQFLGTGKPELKFSEFDIPNVYMFKFLLDFFVSIIPMVVIQYWISLRIENLVTSLGLGLLGLLVGLLFKNWPHIVYFPYAMPFQMWNYQLSKSFVSQNFFWINIAYTLLFLALSYHDFTRRFRG